VFTIYLAPASKGGSDSHTGLTTSSPILTLARAQQVLQQKKPDTNVQVRITQGTYVAGETDWTYYIPGRTIAFMPVNYVLGQGRPAGGDQVFSETSKHFWWWFHALEPSAATAPLHNGGTSGLQFYYLAIEGYANGIGLDGQTGHPSVNSQGLYIKPSSGLNGNSVKGMTFQNVGDKYGPGPGIDGFGAILLTDSSNNIISNNTFDNIENTGSTTGQVGAPGRAQRFLPKQTISSRNGCAARFDFVAVSYSRANMSDPTPTMCAWLVAWSSMT
jgi:hypothetical protein